MFDVLVVGGGAAGMSCALVLGSAKSKPFAEDKRHWDCYASTRISFANCII